MKTESTRIIIGFVVISLIWGSTWMFIKLGLDSISPVYGVLLRFLLASGILYGMVRFKRLDFPWDKTAVYLYVTLGALSFSIPYVLVYWGEQHIGSGLASVIFCAYPFVVAVGSHYFIPSERLNMGKVVGIIFGFAGILFIFWSDLVHEGESAMGMVALLGSATMQAISLVIVKRANHPIGPISLTLGGLIFGVIILLPLALVFEDMTRLRFDLAGIGSIVFLGVMGTIVALVSYYWLMKKIEIVYLSLVSFVTPVVAIILGTLILGEELSSRVFTGGAIVLIGILAANWQAVIRLLHRKVEPKVDES